MLQEKRKQEMVQCLCCPTTLTPNPILFNHPLVPKFPTAQLIAKYILKYVKKNSCCGVDFILVSASLGWPPQLCLADRVTLSNTGIKPRR